MGDKEKASNQKAAPDDESNVLAQILKEVKAMTAVQTKMAEDLDTVKKGQTTLQSSMENVTENTGALVEAAYRSLPKNHICVPKNVRSLQDACGLLKNPMNGIDNEVTKMAGYLLQKNTRKLFDRICPNTKFEDKGELWENNARKSLKDWLKAHPNFKNSKQFWEKTSWDVVVKFVDVLSSFQNAMVTKSGAHTKAVQSATSKLAHDTSGLAVSLILADDECQPLKGKKSSVWAWKSLDFDGFDFTPLHFTATVWEIKSSSADSSGAKNQLMKRAAFLAVVAGMLSMDLAEVKLIVAIKKKNDSSQENRTETLSAEGFSRIKSMTLEMDYFRL